MVHSCSALWLPARRTGRCSDLTTCRCALIPDSYHRGSIRVPIVDESVIWRHYTSISGRFMVCACATRYWSGSSDLTVSLTVCCVWCAWGTGARLPLVLGRLYERRQRIFIKVAAHAHCPQDKHFVSVVTFGLDRLSSWYLIMLKNMSYILNLSLKRVVWSLQACVSSPDTSSSRKTYTGDNGGRG